MLEEKQRIFDAFADKSEAAQESLELDNKTFANLIEEEIERINSKNSVQTASIDQSAVGKIERVPNQNDRFEIFMKVIVDKGTQVAYT